MLNNERIVCNLVAAAPLPELRGVDLPGLGQHLTRGDRRFADRSVRDP